MSYEKVKRFYVLIIRYFLFRVQFTILSAPGPGGRHASYKLRNKSRQYFII